MRRAVRKAEKEQVRIEVSSKSEAIDSYYRLHQITRKKHGIPPQPLRFFQSIHKFLIQKGLGTVFLARFEQKTIAGAIFLHLGSSSVYKFGASDAHYQEIRPNNLLLWNAILHMKKIGAQTLSFGRTSLEQEGLRRFKRGFGASESVLRYIRYCFKSETFAPREPDRSAGLHTSIFRLCPNFLCRLAGAMIYPHIG